jgi:type II secretory pathway pseudopilin PulG
MSGTRKRRGTTLVELSLVIAILAMVALPFVAFVSQNLKNTVQSSTQLKEQMVLEQVMQDMEEHLRSAIRTPPMDNPPIPNKVVFASRDPQPDPQPASNPPLQPAVVTTHSYTYEYRADEKLFYKNGTVFPDGLEPDTITGLKFPTSNLNPTHPPCYITVRIEAHDTSLQRTIYLRNYTSVVDIAKILGVTAPVPGATPTSAIPATSEYTATEISWSGSPVTFAAGTPYTATITLTPIAGYTLTGVAANFFTVDGATSVTNPAGSGTTIVVTAVFPAIGATQLAIAGTALTTSKPYDGNATATVTAVGTLSGVVGGDTVTVSAVATYDTAAVGTGKTITVVYSLAGADAAKYVKPVDYTVTTGVITLAPINIAAILGVTPPVKNATPVTTITQTDQYTGIVTWGDMPGGKFKTKTVYIAIITITPKPGYTLTGVAANFFTVAGTSVPATNIAGSGVVTAIFPETEN